MFGILCSLPYINYYIIYKFDFLKCDKNLHDIVIFVPVQLQWRLKTYQYTYSEHCDVLYSLFNNYMHNLSGLFVIKYYC